jgi:hypothetical protein
MGSVPSVQPPGRFYPNIWDVDKGEATNGCAEVEIINDYLLNVRLEIKKRYNILLTTKDYVSAEDVKNNFKGKKEVKKTFFDLVKQFIAFHQKRFEKEFLHINYLRLLIMTLNSKVSNMKTIIDKGEN